MDIASGRVQKIIKYHYLVSHQYSNFMHIKRVSQFYFKEFFFKNALNKRVSGIYKLMTRKSTTKTPLAVDR